MKIIPDHTVVTMFAHDANAALWIEGQGDSIPAKIFGFDYKQ